MSWMREPNSEPIPGYRLIEPLGSGGFGEVWKCEAPGGIFKAIKFVYGNLNSVDVDGARAEQELHALQRVKEVRHPFICSLDRIEVVEGELVIVMELAERTLYDLFVEHQASGLIGIPRDDLMRYLRDAAEALDHMNEKHKLQHLDVKPRNLFLIGDRCKVADFGLVKHLERLSASGLLGGVTPLYAPPETFNGKISERSDQYSLAIVYQEMLTGQRPFAGKNVRQLAQQHLQEDPDLRALPEAERPILNRCLAKDPAKRFPTCMAFLAALYRARNPARLVETPLTPLSGEPVFVGKSGRPKTMAETMEDIQLEAVELSNGSGQAAHAVAAPAKPRAAKAAQEDGDVSVSQLGLTIPQPETGALRPTLIIGVGGFGRKALLELRCRYLDRFGDLNKLPLLRFLCLDPDSEALNVAVRGAPEVALSRNEVYHLPLQAVGNYRRRSIELLSEWLPREKLYAMPRSLQPQGCRALGRLAFADNQQRLLARLRRDIQAITHPDTVYQSVTQTGLALRDNTPRIYVLSAAGGGSSGLLADLGYALRRVLAQLRHPDARVTAMLLCGSPGDPATPKLEQANIYATLTELNHFSDPAIPFAAQYGTEGQRLVDQGTPFSSVYVLPLAHRTPDALEETVAHLGSYLFHELTTPLGLRLDSLRQEEEASSSSSGPLPGLPASPLRSFGTFAVWFPRGLLMRMASRQACRRLLETWCASGEAEVSPEAMRSIEALLQQVSGDASLKTDALIKRIEETSVMGDLGVTAAEALTGFLATLEEQALQSVAQNDPVHWAKQALSKVSEWVGASEESEVNEWRKTRLNRALGQAVQKVAEHWDQELARGLVALMEHPGARLAAVETAFIRLQRFCVSSSEGQRERIEQQKAKTIQAWKQVEAAIDGLQAGGGGFRLFGSRSRARQLREFTDALSNFARQRLAEETFAAVRHFFTVLSGRLLERGRELGFCRQRLRHLHESLETGTYHDLEDTEPQDLSPHQSPIASTEAFWETIRQSATARVVLPDAEQDLERAAIRFLQALKPEQWTHLDKELHERVLAPRGGLHGACVHSGDLARLLALPLLEETSSILGEHLPIMDVAQILSAEFGVNCDANQLLDPAADNTELAEQVKAYLERARPLLPGKDGKDQHTFLLVPGSPAGRAFGEAVRTVLPDIKLVRVPGQSDLMLCREQANLSLEELQRVLRSCRAAYESLAATPATSPHARFDILDWLPLDP